LGAWYKNVFAIGESLQALKKLAAEKIGGEKKGFLKTLFYDLRKKIVGIFNIFFLYHIVYANKKSGEKVI
jgi:hypothetical protein